MTITLLLDLDETLLDTNLNAFVPSLLPETGRAPRDRTSRPKACSNI